MTPSPHKPPEAFSAPLPFDPLRLIYGIRERWLLFVVLPLCLGVLGWIVGERMMEDRYSVSLQLIKSEVQNAVQTSEAGQAFKPRELSDDTLLSTTYSTEVLTRTGERLTNERAAGAVKAMVEIEKQRNTSLFYLTAHSRLSAADAIETVTVWADEVIRFTNNLQREEARQMEIFISEQLDSIELQLAQVNRQILDFTRENHFVDVDMQTESSLSALENLRMDLANTQIELEVKEVQIKRYRDELRSQSPVEADLKRKREELTYLRGRYTDKNPLVEEKLYEIEHLREQIKDISSAPLADLKNFTGSELGNNLYLEVIALESEREQLVGRQVDFKRRLEAQELLVSGLPEKALQLSELKSKRNLLINAQALLDSRRKEASFYETKGRGYWRVFQRPSENEVVHSSQNLKALGLCLLGLVVGLFVAFLAAFLWEYLQTGLRTPLEASIATSALPLFRYITEEGREGSFWSRRLFRREESASNDRSIKAFWLTQTANIHGREVTRFLFVHTGESVGEIVFWSSLLDLPLSENRRVVFCNLDAGAAPELDPIRKHPAISQWIETIEEIPSEEGDYVIVRLNRMPTSNEVSLLLSLDAYFLLTSPSVADRDEATHKSEVFRKLMGPASGMIILDESSGQTMPRVINSLEMSILGGLIQSGKDKA